MKQNIKCSVEACKHLNCEDYKCKLNEIKVCNCNSGEEKEATMCDSFEKKS